MTSSKQLTWMMPTNSSAVYRYWWALTNITWKWHHVCARSHTYMHVLRIWKCMYVDYILHIHTRTLICACAHALLCVRVCVWCVWWWWWIGGYVGVCRVCVCVWGCMGVYLCMIAIAIFMISHITNFYKNYPNR